eukprot:3059254-Pyramimonas_sp.AAC.1
MLDDATLALPILLVVSMYQETASGSMPSSSLLTHLPLSPPADAKRIPPPALRVRPPSPSPSRPSAAPQ